MKRVKAQLGSRTKKLSKQKIAQTVGQLFLVGERMPSKVRRAILDVGQPAVPFLIELLFDPRTADEPIPGPGLFPLHAIELLGELRANEAVLALEAFRDGAFPDGPVAIAIDAALEKIREEPAPTAVVEEEAAPDDEDDDDPRARLLKLARALAGT